MSLPNTHTAYIESDGGMPTGRKGEGKERGRMEGGREGARGWREEAMMLGRDGAGRGTRKGWRKGELRKGISKKGTQRGMDVARDRGDAGSERRRHRARKGVSNG